MDDLKRYCRVCGKKVPGQHTEGVGRRCASCLHRTHGEHMARNNRVCLKCSGEELEVPGEYNREVGLVSLLHLTDLHFGVRSETVKPDLQKWLQGSGINYILISGDITATAKKEEYERAAGWINDIEHSGIRVAVVPGNHDIGYWGNIMSVGRLAAGRKYQGWIEIIEKPVEPCLRGPSFVALGLNSSHGPNPARFLNGFLRRGQRERAVEILRATPESHLKVIFCHHPLVRFENNRHRAMFRAGPARDEFINAGADILLWGHQHSFNTTEFVRSGGKCIAVQSPTLSERAGEGQYPGFAVIEWHFQGKAVIKSYRVPDKYNIEEDKRIEYSL